MPLYARVGHETIQDVELIGWSSDGKLIAYKKTIGFVLSEKDWLLQYIDVKELPSQKSVEIFKIKKEGNQEYFIPEDWRIFKKGKSKKKWEYYKKKHNFKKGYANPVSPSSNWKVKVTIERKKAFIETSTKAMSEVIEWNMEKKYESEIFLDYDVKGIKLFTEEEEWPLIFSVESDKDLLKLYTEILISGKNGARGRYYGNLGVYWGPKERSVVIEWVWGPIAGSGQWADLIIGELPRIDKTKK